MGAGNVAKDKASKLFAGLHATVIRRSGGKIGQKFRGAPVQLRASVADAATKARLWPDLLTMYKTYESYQKKTDREIPVVLLSPR